MLTTLVRAKAFYDIDDDSLYTSLLEAASSTIRRYCGRYFNAADYRIADRGDFFILPEYPVIRVASVAIGRTGAFAIVNESADAQDASVEVDDTTLTLTIEGGTNDGTEELTLADYGTMADLCDAILALNDGWSITRFIIDRQPKDLLPQGAFACLDYCTYIQCSAERLSRFRLDKEAATIALPVFGDVDVRYRAGYETVPDDLQQICIDLAKVYNDSKSVVAGIESEKIGDYSYKLAQDAGGENLLPSTIQTRLSPWRRYA